MAALYLAQILGMVGIVAGLAYFGLGDWKW